MKYIDEFRDPRLAGEIAKQIEREALGSYHLMEFCGGHTHAVSRHGIKSLLPHNVSMIHGPGCPVCVLPVGRIDNAIGIAEKAILCTYADMMRVPASGGGSLMQARASGADIRMVYSSQDAVRIARAHPEREVVFFAIGFETTAPSTAAAIVEAQDLDNFSVFCNHVLTPPAMQSILDTPDLRLNGILGPSHVSTVIGTKAYEGIVSAYKVPMVIAGFEPLDVMQSILMLVRQLNEGRAEVENEYTRAVSHDGNLKAQRLMEQVFVVRPSFEWRGLGEVPLSALSIAETYSRFDAESRFCIAYTPVPDAKACECGEVLRGLKQPQDCRVFGTACTPSNPIGACMVSSEGACAAHYAYGRTA